jgi:hypothetical protein
MKLFTIEEANTLIPTVREMLTRLRAAHATVLSLRDEAKIASSRAEFGGGGMINGVQYVGALEVLATESHELDSMGVQIKDYDRGLIDFPAMRDGKIVLLCWQLGENEEVEWWHDLEAGFAGRQPL